MSALTTLKEKAIIKNGFEEVGIVHTIENQVISEAKEDPFADIDLNITIETLIIPVTSHI